MRRRLKFTAILAAAWLLLCFGFAHANIDDIRLKANWQIEDLFGVSNFFKEKVTVKGKQWPFKVVSNYDFREVNCDFREVKELKFNRDPAEFPALCYENDNKGKFKNGYYQFLGQTKDGEVVTDVRYPLESNWGENVYMEDLNWVPDPWSNQKVRSWWKSYSGSELIMSKFDERVRSNANLAKTIDECIMISNLVQVREENGKILMISDAWAENRQSKKFSTFPWHNYVHILIPPSEDTWGFGIGFVDHGYRIGYKSFPIAPINLDVILPDIAVKADQPVYTGQPGDKVAVKVTLMNLGDPATTNLGWLDVDAINRGADWTQGNWLENEVFLAKNEKKEYTVEFTVGNTEKKYFFRANTDGFFPEGELDLTNNGVVITVTPGRPDLAVRSDKDVYEGAPGSQVSIIAAVKNIGNASAVTDFGARWEADGWDKALFKKDSITINAGEDPHYTVTVAVPQTEKKLVLRANIDGNTPPNEVTLDNNTKMVTVRPVEECTDISVKLKASPSVVNENQPSTLTATMTRANDGPSGSVTVNVTMAGPVEGSTTKTVSLAKGQSKTVTWTSKRFVRGQQITFKVTATSVEVKDCRPGNNTDSTTITVRDPEISVQPSDSDFFISIIR